MIPNHQDVPVSAPQSLDEMEARLQRLIGRRISTNLPTDKGWRGKEVERLVGLALNNRPESDEYAHELKTVVGTIDKSGMAMPKDGRIAVCQVTEDHLTKERFEHSSCWKKLSRFILVLVQDRGKWSSESTILYVRGYKFQDDSAKFSALKADYEWLQRFVKRRGFDALSRALVTPNGLLHIGTKGTKASSTRAFYLNNKALKK
jgi:DNA mismatch repair protein MutH